MTFIETSCYDEYMTIRQILSGPDPVAVLTAADHDGTLHRIEPSLAALRMEVPAGHHHKDNLTHSLKVLQNAIDRETTGSDLILRTAALFHDVGKPATRVFNGRNSVSFDGHEHVGAHMVRKILKAHGYTKKEIQDVSLLVTHHMRSHGYQDVPWTDSGVRSLITDVGDEAMMEKLIIIFYSDATTGIAKKLRAHHKSVDMLAAHIQKVKKDDARKALRPALNGNQVMDMFSLTPGKELGAVMRFLNSDEGVRLTAAEAEAKIREKFFA